MFSALKKTFRAKKMASIFNGQNITAHTFLNRGK